MSKIGRKPIEIPEGVSVEIAGKELKVSGKLGVLVSPILPDVQASIEDGNLNLSVKSAKKQAIANWGTTAALARNSIEGVMNGYKKELEIQGVGFKAVLNGSTLVLNLGFSHTIEYMAPEGVEIAVEKNNLITISGIDKAMVGQVAAEIRAYKKPEPYQGKGIRYVGEKVRRKQGKKVAGAA